MTSDAQVSLKKFNTRRALLVAMIAASVVGSLASAWETYLGLSTFTAAGLSGGIIAFGVTFMVQVLLFVISWVYVQNPRSDKTVKIALLSTWIICALISGFFSFFGFFFDNGGRSGENRKLHVEEELGQVNDVLMARLDSAKSTMIAPLITDSDAAVREWNADLAKLLTQARDAESILQQAVLVRRSELEAEQQQDRVQLVTLANQLNGYLRAVKDLTDEVTRADEELGRRQNQLAVLDSELVELETRIDARQVARDAEAADGGCGAECQAIEREITNLRQDRLGKLSAINSSQQRVREAEEARDDAREILGSAPEQDEITRLEGDIENINGQVQSRQGRLDTQSTGVSFSIATIENEFASLRGRLNGGDVTAYAALTEWCNATRLPMVAEVDLRGAVEGIECNPAPLQSRVGQVIGLEDATTAVSECLNNDVQPGQRDPATDYSGTVKRMSSADLLLLQPLFDETKTCLQMAPAALLASSWVDRYTDNATSDDMRDTMVARGGRDALDQRVNRLEQLRGDLAQPAEVAATALVVDREFNAVLALVFAIFIDALVFLCAFIGTALGISETARAVDLIMRHSRTPVAPKDDEERILRVPAKADEQEAIQEVLNTLLREGFAEYRNDDETEVVLYSGASQRLAALRASDSMDKFDPDPRRVAPMPERLGARPERRFGARPPRA